MYELNLVLKSFLKIIFWSFFFVIGACSRYVTEECCSVCCIVLLNTLCWYNSEYVVIDVPTLEIS